jgi:hypothetical protein
MKDRAYTVELHIDIDLKEPARSQTGRYLTFIVQWHEQTHGGSVETLVQVNVIEPLDWAEVGPVIVSGRTPGAQKHRTTALRWRLDKTGTGLMEQRTRLFC